MFHYTPIFHAVLILRDGVIRRSSGNTPPYVWLSSNPTNEPTALRASSEQVRRCNDERMRRAIEGRARFVFHGCNATPWANLTLTAEVRSNLEQLAAPKGGRPEEWFALPNNVSCTALPLEIEIDGSWRRIAHDDLKREYQDLQMMDGAIRMRRSRALSPS